MTTEEILEVWECFDGHMSNKFFDGLTQDDIEEFTFSEWRASFQLPATEFKRRFMDQMKFDEIIEVTSYFDEEDMNDWLLQLTLKDFKHFTNAEWEAFFFGVDNEDDIIEFVNYNLKRDPQIVFQILLQFETDAYEVEEETAQAWRHVKQYLKR